MMHLGTNVRLDIAKATLLNQKPITKAIDKLTAILKQTYNLDDRSASLQAVQLIKQAMHELGYIKTEE
jgi:hypothetical protein